MEYACPRQAKGEEMLKASEWATERCEIHDMVSCADCLDRAKLRRTDSGEIAYRDDCAVRTIAASEVLREAGASLGSGTSVEALLAAFRSVGSSVREVTRIVKIESAPALSRSGRRFAVAGWAGRDGHAWTIIDGSANRDFLRTRRYSYRIFEITA
jgi:hypothetical protein